MDSSQFDEAELQDLSIRIMKYFVNNSITKYSIKKSDIVKHPLNGNSKIFPRAFKSACNQLADVNFSARIPQSTFIILSFQVYGFTVTEIPKSTTKSYICTTYLPALTKPKYLPQKYRYNWNLLSLVLSYIFMKGGSISDRKQLPLNKCFLILMFTFRTGAVFVFLKRFGISDDEEHPIHGNIRKKIHDIYPRQFYLVKTKVTEESSNDYK